MLKLKVLDIKNEPSYDENKLNQSIKYWEDQSKGN